VKSAFIRVLFLFVISIVPLSIFAQKDSLLLIINGEKTSDVIKYQSFLQLIKEYSNTDAKKALLFSEQARAWAEGKKPESYLGQFYYETAQIYYYQLNEFQQAINYYLLAIPIQLDLKESENLAKSYTNAGNTYHYLAQFQLAARYYQQGLSIFEELNHYFGQSLLLNNLGVVNQHLGNYSKAADYYFRALRLAETQSDSTNIAMCYANIGTTYFDNSEYELSKKYLDKSILLYTSLNDSTNLSNCYINLGNVATHTHKYHEALLHYNKAILISEFQQNLLNKAFAIQSIAGVYLIQNKTKIALEELSECIAIYSKTDNTKDLINCKIKLAEAYLQDHQYVNARRVAISALEQASSSGISRKEADGYLILSKIYKAEHDGQKAMEFLEKHYALKDSLFSITTEKNIQELNILYETEKKEQQIVQLEQEKQIEHLKATRKLVNILILSIFLLFAALSGFIIARQNKIRSRERESVLNQKLLRAQMNPHFIFNSLNSINLYISENKPFEASNFLTRFAKLMRNILESSKEETISLSKEIETLRYYLELEKLRFQNKFNFFIEVADSIDPDEFDIPPMLIQPFVENAIIHGLKQVPENGEIRIGFVLLENDILLAEVIDNGIGINSSVKSESRSSYSMEITRERLERMNKKRKKEILFRITDLISEGHQGTKVEISIPF
jgi:tetratricopeptide (TPR) repeat protein